MKIVLASGNKGKITEFQKLMPNDDVIAFSEILGKFEIIEDIGSGINYDKKGLRQLIDKIDNQEVGRVVILYKDNLVRFGFEIIEYLCQINGVELEIIDHTEKTKDEELKDDLIQIITVFANRLYGQGSKKTKRLIDEVKSNDIGDKDKTETN